MAGADRSKGARTALQLVGRAATAFYARSVLVTLCGGVGAARMLSGLVRVVPPSSITAVVNTGDDTILHGLHISPDLDTVTYTLAGMDNRQAGWGMAGESWTVMEELTQLGGESWFRLGDRDLATHLFRTERLRTGATLSEVTTEIAARRHVDVHLLPATNDPVRTMLTLAEATDLGPAGTEVGFQDYFVRLHHEVAVRTVRFGGAESARPAPGVLEALTRAEQIVVCPSNPIVSIGPLLAIPGVLAALTPRRDDIVAVSPIIAGVALKGPADRLMTELGTEASVVGVARLYAPWVGTLVVDEADRAEVASVEAEGVRCLVAPTIMDTPERAEALARRVIDAHG
jgi:LPPG:FO 2-phospho-L-lactate transferase